MPPPNIKPAKQEDSSVKSKVILMKNLSEEDSFAASNLEDEEFAPEESIVNQGRTKPKIKTSPQV